MYSTTDFKRGLKIELDGTPMKLLNFSISNPEKAARWCVPNSAIS